MRTSRLLRFVAIVCGALAIEVSAQDEPAQERSTGIDDLIAELGDPAFSVRESAQAELWKRGDAAIPALEKALLNENPEIARRANELLDKLAWGIRADTPPAILKLLKNFQLGDKDAQKSAEIRRNAIVQLIEAGTPGIRVARAILRKNLSPELHESLVVRVASLLHREIPLRLFEGKVEAAEELIALNMADLGMAGAADFAAFHYLRRDLPQIIAKVEGAGKSRRDKRLLEPILAHLYRARGDWARARATAAEIATPPDSANLVESLLEEEGNWTGLTEAIQPRNTNHPDAVRSTLLRLAGKAKEFDEAAARILKQADEFSTAEEANDAAIALLANNRMEDAVRVLSMRKQNLGLLAETLIARLQFKEALALSSGDDKLPTGERQSFDLRRGRLLAMIGHRDSAVQLFNKASEGVSVPVGEPGNSLQLVRALLRAESRVGMKELACEHAARFLASERGRFDGALGETAFETLFGRESTECETLFWALREKNIPSNEPGRTMARVRVLMRGKGNQEIVDEALRALDAWTGAALVGYPQTRYEAGSFASKKLLARAAVCRAAKRDFEADADFKKAAEASPSFESDSGVAGPRSWVFGTSDASRPWIEWGDSLMERGLCRDAAARFEEGWRKYPDQPLLLFLSGRSLAISGDVKEGERRMELAHWVSLGQERIRGRFLEELVRRGEAKAAERETELILKACWPRDHYFGNAMNQAARAAVLNRDFAAAEQCVQRSLLVILKTPGVYFVETSAYANVPQDMLVYRTRACLAEGKVEEAMDLARRALNATPGHVELVSGMVPELDRLGKKREADELFESAWNAHRKVLEQFPDSPFACNALASLAANCRRELDKGQVYAEAAAKANPDFMPYRETLAEVYFRRGFRSEAIEALSKPIEEDPRNQFYRRQLKRYRDGPLDSGKPERADD